MKKLPFYLGLFFVLPLLTMCQKESNINSIIILDKSISQDEITLNFKGDKVQLDKEIKEIFLDNINKKFKIKADDISSIIIEQTDNPTFDRKNLIFTLSSSSGQEMPPVAIVFTQKSPEMKSGAVKFIATASHSCTGNPCGCCSFAHDTSGNITGCVCNGNDQRWGICPHEEGQKCNHTITSN